MNDALTLGIPLIFISLDRAGATRGAYLLHEREELERILEGGAEDCERDVDSTLTRVELMLVQILTDPRGHRPGSFASLEDRSGLSEGEKALLKEFYEWPIPRTDYRGWLWSQFDALTKRGFRHWLRSQFHALSRRHARKVYPSAAPAAAPAE